MRQRAHQRRRGIARYFVLPVFVKDEDVIRLEANIRTRSLMTRGDAVITTSTCGNCWDDIPKEELVSLCGGQCEFGFCRPCGAKTYQLLGRKNFLHSRGGPQTCRGLQCDGCRRQTPLNVVLNLKSELAQHRLLSDEGAEANEADGAETDLALLNSAVALKGCETAEALITREVEGNGETGQKVLLRNEAGVSVRLCDGLVVEEEFDLSMLPDPTDCELAALQLPEPNIKKLEGNDPMVRKLAEADRMYTEIAKQLIVQQGGFDAKADSRKPLHEALLDVEIPGGTENIQKLDVKPDYNGARCVHSALVVHTLAGACRALHGGVNLAVPPAICFQCQQSREKLNGVKRKAEALRQRHEDEKGNVDAHKRNFIKVLKASKKLTRCPFCQTPAIHTNACDHMQCVKATCRKHFCRGCSLNKWLLELGAQVEERYVGKEARLRNPNNYGGNSADNVYRDHLNTEHSCNPGRSCFNPEAQRNLHDGEEERLIAASTAYGTALDIQGGAAPRPAARQTSSRAGMLRRALNIA